MVCLFQIPDVLFPSTLKVMSMNFGVVTKKYEILDIRGHNSTKQELSAGEGYTITNSLVDNFLSPEEF